MRPQDCICGWVGTPWRVSSELVEYRCARCARVWRERRPRDQVPVQRSLEGWE
jgi:hypothetical protein